MRNLHNIYFIQRYLNIFNLNTMRISNSIILLYLMDIDKMFLYRLDNTYIKKIINRYKDIK